MGFINGIMEALMSVVVWIVSVVFMVCAPIFWLFGYKLDVAVTKRKDVESK